MMQARDAAGRQVSLLNDDASAQHFKLQEEQQHQRQHQQQQHYSDPVSMHHQRPSYRSTNHVISQPFLARSTSGSPNTPELLRSDSYDSQMSSDAFSPLTPSAAYAEYSRSAHYTLDSRASYDEYMTDVPPMKRPGALAERTRSSSHDEDLAAASPASSGATSDKASKRYPCRYRDSHGCEKTFTTSGHASRHSKIHTAEKAVQCTFPGCAKKFTRADNMKQHLETHFKDKSRSSAANARPTIANRRSSSSAKSTSGSSNNSAASGITKPSSARAPASQGGAASAATISTAATLPSPVLAAAAAAAGASPWDMRSLTLPAPAPSRPLPIARNPSSGLDALAMAVACQEGGA